MDMSHFVRKPFIFIYDLYFYSRFEKDDIFFILSGNGFANMSVMKMFMD